MRKLALLGGITAMLLAGSASTASATTFDGSCDTKGHLYFSEPYRFVHEYRDYTAETDGTCEGTLDGQPYNGPVHVYVDGRMNRPMACLNGQATDVPTKLTFGNGKEIDLVMRVEGHVYAILPFVLRGAFNGHGAGQMEWIGYHGPEDLQSCIQGPGVDGPPINLTLQSITPFYG